MEAKTGGKEVRMIQEPKYEMCERLGCLKEVDAPDGILFEELGWDREPTVTKEKHYRKFVPKELEHCVEVMSKPSEFNCYELKRGQSRGAKASIFSFGPTKKDASGEEDTTSKMGLFKALITVTHRDTEEEHKMFILNKLAVIRRRLAEIYRQRNPGKTFPVREGFFCEDTLQGSKVMTADQRERAYSDDIKGPEDTKNNFTE